jgi:hypothetical protein
MADLLHRSLSTPEAGIAVVAVGADRDAPGLEAPRSQGVDTFVVDFVEADRVNTSKRRQAAERVSAASKEASALENQF